MASLRDDHGYVPPGRWTVTAGVGCAVAAVLSFAVLAAALLSAALAMRGYGFSLRDRAVGPLSGAAVLCVAGLALGVAVLLLRRHPQVGRLATVLLCTSLVPVIAVMLWIVALELEARSAGAGLTAKLLVGLVANVVALLSLIGAAVLLSLPVADDTLARPRKPDWYVVAATVPVVVASFAGTGALALAIWADALLRDSRLTPDRIGELSRLVAILVAPAVVCVAGLQLTTIRRRLGGTLAGFAAVALMFAIWCVTAAAVVPFAISMDAPWSVRAPVIGLTIGAAGLILAGQAGVIAGIIRFLLGAGPIARGCALRRLDRSGRSVSDWR